MRPLKLLQACGAVLAILPGGGFAQASPEPTAILARQEGQVTLADPGREAFRSVRRAMPRQLLRSGQVLHLPAGARATVVCSTETLFDLVGPADWRLDGPACGKGRPLPEGAYRGLAPRAGRILPRKGSLLLELATRNGGTEPAPILLNPRSSVVQGALPPLVWTRVPGALQYEIELRGATSRSLHPAPGDLRCEQGAGPWRDTEVCSWFPAGGWPSLEPNEPLLLRVGFRRSPEERWRYSPEASEVRFLPEEARRELEGVLDQVERLPLAPADRLRLAAGASAQRGLLSDAIRLYDESLQLEEVPEVRVALGDLYLRVELAAWAGRSYRQVLAGPAGPAAWAAAELGLGEVSYGQRVYREARDHFERALRLYMEAGLPAEAEEVRQALGKL